MFRAALVFAILGAAILGGPAAAGADGGGLEPGGLTRFKEHVTVNVVFVGFDEDEAPWNRVRSQLPARGEPIVRSRASTSSRRATSSSPGSATSRIR